MLPGQGTQTNLCLNSPIRLSSNRDLISAILSRAFRRMLRVGRRERRGLDEAQSVDFLFWLIIQINLLATNYEPDRGGL